ncbi:MAG TPA: hypothetical protein VLG13_03065 [Patescibacteria group bacterium]|nr:hypothetical protein [Patescibacteria group bacterium]
MSNTKASALDDFKLFYEELSSGKSSGRIRRWRTSATTATN